MPKEVPTKALDGPRLESTWTVKVSCNEVRLWFPENSAAEMKLLTATLEPDRGMGASDPPGPIKTSRDTCFFHGYESPVVITPPYLLLRLREGWMPAPPRSLFSTLPFSPNASQPVQHLCRSTVQLRDGLACSRSNRTGPCGLLALPTHPPAPWGEDITTPSGEPRTRVAGVSW